jgi:hypothetical protein
MSTIAHLRLGVVELYNIQSSPIQSLNELKGHLNILYQLLAMNDAHHSFSPRYHYATRY